METKKHIVLLTPGFREDESDTRCLPFLSEYVDELIKSDACQLTIIALHYPPKKVDYSDRGVRILTQNFRSVRWLKPFQWWKVLRLLAMIHKNSPIDVVHSFWLGECALIGRRFSLAKKVRHITTLPGQDALMNNIFAKLLPLRKMVLVAVSDFQARLLRKNYNANPIVIPNGIKKPILPNNRAIQYDLIGVGSLIRLKDYDFFLDVVDNIKLQKPEIKALILGEGPEHNHLVQKINRLGLEEQVVLQGSVPRHEVFEYMAQSRVFMHPSQYEAFGLVFSEALAVGLNIVSREVGIAVPSENWIVAHDIDSFTQAYFQLQDHTNAPIARSFYRVEDMVKAYQDLYNQRKITGTL